MLNRAALFIACGVLGLVAGAGLVTLAMGASEAPQPAPIRPQIVSSSTNLQSFLWVYDDTGRTVTFCFTAASPANGPQYDFSCRSHPISDAVTPN
ncbi:MAG TPA: hypothetical protein VMA53_04485 [Stellaceae bacterium]|nr:hypothetical protein [Stellaceae bacterium]